MKKTILLALMALTIMACPSSDDDGNGPMEVDQLVGNWKLSQYFENDVTQEIETCDLEDTFTFAVDGTFSLTVFGEINEACVLDETLTGTWTNDGDNSYTAMLSDTSETAVFTVNGNTFTFEDVYDNDTPNDTSDDVVERSVYTRQ